jgi:hypothetical protein
VKITPQQWTALQSLVVPLWREGKDANAIFTAISTTITGYEETARDPYLVYLERAYIGLLSQRGLKSSDGFSKIFNDLTQWEITATGEEKVSALSFGMKIKILADQIRDNYAMAGFPNLNATDATGLASEQKPIYSSVAGFDLDQEDVESVINPKSILPKEGVLAPQWNEQWLPVIRSNHDLVFVEFEGQEIAFSRDNIAQGKI